MLRSITGYLLDEDGHWVAELECGHHQHVRHDPPWQLRAWATMETGRHAHLGKHLKCLKCERGAARDF